MLGRQLNCRPNLEISDPQITTPNYRRFRQA